MTDSARTFFVSLHKRDGQTTGHTISTSPPVAKEDTELPPTPPSEPKVGGSKDLTFAAVFSNLSLVMTSYRNYIPFTLALAPMLSAVMAEKKIRDFATNKGALRSDLCSPDKDVYEMDIRCYAEFALHSSEVRGAVDGARHLSEVMVIGLVSAYDAFLSRLLHAAFIQKPHLVLTSDKSIKFSDLSRYTSIDAARDALIDREVESVIRQSHHEQFIEMQNLFDIKLKVDLVVWPKFIEVCERRNLITHTGGIVSEQYLQNCKAHGYDTKDLKVGDKLSVTGKYFGSAVRVVFEIAIKLCWVVWHKLSPKDHLDADKALNAICYELVFAEEYVLAEALLSFATTQMKKAKANEQIRLMMVVNLANAVRLQNREGEAKALLDQEDWSAVSDDFRISVAAVRSDVKAVTEIMKKLGSNSNFDIEQYRTWPVFRGLNGNANFLTTFEEVFGEPFVKASSVSIPGEHKNEGESSSSLTHPHPKPHLTLVIPPAETSPEGSPP